MFILDLSRRRVQTQPRPPQGLLIVRERETQELQSRRRRPAVMPQGRRDVALPGQAQQSDYQVA